MVVVKLTIPWCGLSVWKMSCYNSGEMIGCRLTPRKKNCYCGRCQSFRILSVPPSMTAIYKGKGIVWYQVWRPIIRLHIWPPGHYIVYLTVDHGDTTISMGRHSKQSRQDKFDLSKESRCIIPSWGYFRDTQKILLLLACFLWYIV